jgi:hypothetical protein
MVGRALFPGIGYLECLFKVAQQLRYLGPAQQLSDTYFMSFLFRDEQFAATVVEQRQPVKAPGLAVNDPFR